MLSDTNPGSLTISKPFGISLKGFYYFYEIIFQKKKDFKIGLSYKVNSVLKKIKYNIVDEIQPSLSGKYMYAFSRVEDI